MGTICAAGVTTVYVAPDGRDTWSGLRAEADAGGTDGPVASLTAARDVVRTLKAAGRIDGPVRVQVADGRYPMRETLVLTEADSGTEAAPITYAAAPGPGLSSWVAVTSRAYAPPAMGCGRSASPRWPRANGRSSSSG